MSAISVIAPWIVPSLIGEPSTNGDPLGYYIFNGIIYGGIGAVFGYVLPEGVKRYWDALAKGLPDRISVLRTAIAQYFHDIQQFQQWLNTPNDGLQGKRPLDILSEDTGEQRLVSFVSQTRRQVSPRPV